MEWGWNPISVQVVIEAVGLLVVIPGGLIAIQQLRATRRSREAEVTQSLLEQLSGSGAPVVGGLRSKAKASKRRRGPGGGGGMPRGRRAPRPRTEGGLSPDDMDFEESEVLEDEMQAPAASAPEVAAAEAGLEMPAADEGLAKAAASYDMAGLMLRKQLVKPDVVVPFVYEDVLRRFAVNGDQFEEWMTTRLGLRELVRLSLEHARKTGWEEMPEAFAGGEGAGALSVDEPGRSVDTKEEIHERRERCGTESAHPESGWRARLADPGAGHVYAGRAGRGLLWHLFSWVVFLGGTQVALHLPLRGWNVGLWFGLTLGVIVLGVWSAVRTAQRNHDAPRPTLRMASALAFVAAFVVGGPLVLSAIRAHVVAGYSHPTGSMRGTLLGGDFILVDNLAYSFGREPRRGDVVIYRSTSVEPGERLFVKRIVGLPGETVTFQDGKVFIDGEPIQESYLDQESVEFGTSGRTDRPYIVPEGAYFVLGDYRMNSRDSRVDGPVSRADILGRVRVVMWHDRDVYRTQVAPWDRVGEVVR